jgi:hypothetical protein
MLKSELKLKLNNGSTGLRVCDCPFHKEPIGHCLLHGERLCIYHKNSRLEVCRQLSRVTIEEERMISLRFTNRERYSFPWLLPCGKGEKTI